MSSLAFLPLALSLALPEVLFECALFTPHCRFAVALFVAPAVDSVDIFLGDLEKPGVGFASDAASLEPFVLILVFLELVLVPLLLHEGGVEQLHAGVILNALLAGAGLLFLVLLPDSVPPAHQVVVGHLGLLLAEAQGFGAVGVGVLLDQLAHVLDRIYKHLPVFRGFPSTIVVLFPHRRLQWVVGLQFIKIRATMRRKIERYPLTFSVAQDALMNELEDKSEDKMSSKSQSNKIAQDFLLYIKSIDYPEHDPAKIQAVNEMIRNEYETAKGNKETAIRHMWQAVSFNLTVEKAMEIFPKTMQEKLPNAEDKKGFTGDKPLGPEKRTGRDLYEAIYYLLNNQ